MALLWGCRIRNIRTPIPITNAELSSISAGPVTNNAVEPLRSAERTMPVAMRLPTPYAKKPARKRTPTIRAVRRTLESGRTTGGEVEWLEAGIGSTRKIAMVIHPVRKCDVLRRKWMVPGSPQRRDDYCQEHHYPRLVDRSGAAEGELRPGRQRPGDEGHRHLRVRLACDKARTERD